MGAWAAWAVLLMLAGLVGGQGRDTRPLIRPPPEVVGPEGMEEDIPDEAFFVDTVRRNELSESETPAIDERRGGGGGGGGEGGGGGGEGGGGGGW
ncbi:homeobox protein Hox-B3-like [Penaeus monodon]|uniref:homeobox protein Hox-B3-like n=1 Tax=Penaeus monodon TaxID=6687 RepID=UPI0018A73652|nr:homeobox protein Hox-B3-like [Penaeus monodon]